MTEVSRFKRVGAMLLALVLVVMAVAPAAAQGPDVGAAQSVHAGFCLNPNSNTVASTGCPVGVAQIIPSSGTAVTEVTVADVDNLGSVQIAFDYDSDIVQVKDVRPGSLFDNLTMGVDYTIDKSKIGGFGAPLNINPPFAEPALSCGGGDCWRSYIFITIYNWATERVPLNGNGSLIRIYWNVQPAALGAATPLQFPILSMANKSGSSIWPCFPTDGVTPNPYCGPVPMPVLATNAAPVGNLQIGSPSAAGLQFQVALEGGKLPGDGDPNCNFPSTWTLPPPAPPSGLCLNDVSVVAGVFVAVADMQGNIAIPYAAAYPTVTASRPGYLTARAVNLMPGADLGSVQLMAGDVTGDNVVNIFDLTVVAGSLGAPVGNSTALETMDFNGDGVVTIADLALVAKNYNMNGPRPITVIP